MRFRIGCLPEGKLFLLPSPARASCSCLTSVGDLGFPMDPFVRGLMFYYGLEFHDLAPECILQISTMNEEMWRMDSGAKS